MAEGNTPRFGAYDPEADLLDEYGTLPIMPSFVDPTVFGLSGRNPGFAIAADNPGVPVILPTTVPTNPHRYLKGVRYEQPLLRVGEYDPMAVAEGRNPMAPNIPPGVSFADERGMDPALIGAMLGGAAPYGAGRGISASSGLQESQRAAGAAADLYRRGMAGERVAYDPAYINPRKFVQFSDDPYMPTSYRGEFPDKRMMKDVARERTMLVPKPGRATMRDERMAPEVTRRTSSHRPLNTFFDEGATPYQSGADFGDRRMMEVRARSPFKRRNYPAYDKKFYQTGTARGAHSDPVLADLNLNRQAAMNRLVNARELQAMGEGLSGPGSIYGTLGGAVAGEVYDETFGEGDTRYMDPSGAQRMALRERAAGKGGPGSDLPLPKAFQDAIDNRVQKSIDEALRSHSNASEGSKKLVKSSSKGK
jgi:hypothetical protein